MDFIKYLDNLKKNLEQLAQLDSTKEIQYGHSLRFKRGDEIATLNVYNGKKGIRLVWQGNNGLKEELEAFTNALDSVSKTKKDTIGDGIDKHILLKQNSEGSLEADFSEEIWAGSDESGKGDFFGPLVLGAVALNARIAMELKLAGVKDCKLLTDKKILELEALIKSKALAYAVLQLKPRFYNQRYQEIVAQGGKLNQLLASGHINALTKVIDKLKEQELTCEYALVDQFTNSNIVLSPLKKRYPEISFQQQPKAESNMAVAAASMLARAQFLRMMEELAKQVDLDALPKGGGENATECARSIALEFGKEALKDFVKLHFVNYQRI